jgi:hypothetical protein
MLTRLSAPIPEPGTDLAKATWRFCHTEPGIGNPSARNTKAAQVRVPEEINIWITRTKWHYPAHDGTIATMARQAR